MMKYIFVGLAALTASIPVTTAQECLSGAQEINGNWYCQAVQAISYTNFGTPGTYNKVTTMENGQCGSTPQNYNGGMSPLNEEISWHFRGPLALEQFAFYTPGSSNPSKRNIRPIPHQRRHVHEHFHASKKDILTIPDKLVTEEEKRDVGDWVTVVMDGKTVSWQNNWDGSQTIQTSTTETQPQTTALDVTTSAALPTATMNAGASNWDRQAYYNADAGTVDGLVFLNHAGGQGSGIFDYTWGNSLSYASPDGKTGSSSPQTLSNAMLDDNVEVVIMSDQQCNNNNCGTTRPGTVAYHGFAGADKVFLLEFSMPFTGKTGFNMDMPAIWTLNAQIPRTMQYGPAECSCWESGCGEWDIFEILDSGNTRAKSTYHGNLSGGDSNYFERPTEESVVVAVVFDGADSAGHIVVLGNGTTFDQSIAPELVQGWVNTASTTAQAAVFALPT